MLAGHIRMFITVTIISAIRIADNVLDEGSGISVSAEYADLDGEVTDVGELVSPGVIKSYGPRTSVQMSQQDSASHLSGCSHLE